MIKSILLVHADIPVRRAVRSLLSNDFRLTEAGELSLRGLGNPDLVLIDWNALNPPSESLRWLTRNGSPNTFRVIVLADQSVYGDAVRAIDYGADDCVVIPLQGDELLVRINACVGRRQTPEANEYLTAGPIVLDRRIHRVSVDSKDVELAPTEFRLLAFLLENQGRVFSRNELLTRAWSSNVKAGLRTVDVHVRRLRQQLEPYRCEHLIQTVRGFGYRLRADRNKAEI